MNSPRYVLYPQKGLDEESKAVFVARSTQAHLCPSCMNQLRYGKWHGKCTWEISFIDPKGSRKAFPPEEPGPIMRSKLEEDTKTNLPRHPKTGGAPVKPELGMQMKSDLPWRPSTDGTPAKPDSGMQIKQEDDDEPDLPWRPNTDRTQLNLTQGCRLNKRMTTNQTCSGVAALKVFWLNLDRLSSFSSAVPRALAPSPAPPSPLDEPRELQDWDEDASASNWFIFRWYVQLVIELSALRRRRGGETVLLVSQGCNQSLPECVLQDSLCSLVRDHGLCPVEAGFCSEETAGGILQVNINV
ncbi:uncharacterized protein [Macrobrachium rosenbergii]|uniref:uncharacterized protein n=1 Tax=Macrobrachium rosenbergii TaxID=79674 RepID=UPI0034D752B8